MARIPSYHELEGDHGRELLDQVLAQAERLRQRLAGVRHVVAIGSGKGGVGKSAITANLAAALARRGLRVGAVDADLNGPSLARMLGALPAPLRAAADAVAPAAGAAGVRVISTDLLLGDPDAPLRWRGPAMGAFVWQSSLETATLREFLADVAWGALDVLLLDLPPGTDKLARLLELLPEPAAVLLVSTPSRASAGVVARSVRMLRETPVPRLGLALNMTARACRACGHREPLFPDDDAAADLLRSFGAPAWAEIPFDPRLARHTDAGEPIVLADPEAEASVALERLADRLLEELARPGPAASGRPAPASGPGPEPRPQPDTVP